MCTIFGKYVGVTNVITCDKFFGDQLRDVNSVGGQNLPFPYCVACDIFGLTGFKRF